MKKLIEKGEIETIEFKKSTSELKEAIISIVSILNKHKEGELYFGIKNNKEVVGQSLSEKTIRGLKKQWLILFVIEIIVI